MFYGLSRFIKNLLPKTLFYRALLIVAVPVIVIQLIITIVFFDSLWIKTNKGMTRALVSEIKTFVDAYENEETNKDFIVGLFKDNFDINIKYEDEINLPDHIDENSIINAIKPSKDVDGFSIPNVGLLSTSVSGLIPCTPLGCLLLLKNYVGELSGKSAVIIGRSNIVGKPMAQLLLNENCTVTIAHSKTKNIEAVCKGADILVAAVGRPNFVKTEWVKKGAVVIDVGINRLQPDGDKKGRLVGDVDFDSVSNVASAITPVPGGVGPMTIACLLRNTVTAACKRRNLNEPEM